MAPLLDERSRRRLAASEACMIGHGGVSAVAEATGLARRTIYRGLEDLEDRASVGNDRVRRRGGGRKSRITEDPTLCGQRHPPLVEGHGKETLSETQGSIG